ncbi:MAG: hypothetical protein JO001_25920 [Alphaproteobacteria bacterium]|nr:hypothetical protein [Alphaproteobacteria bacterium]
MAQISDAASVFPRRIERLEQRAIVFRSRERVIGATQINACRGQPLLSLFIRDPRVLQFAFGIHLLLSGCRKLQHQRRLRLHPTDDLVEGGNSLVEKRDSRGLFGRLLQLPFRRFVIRIELRVPLY